MADSALAAAPDPTQGALTQIATAKAQGRPMTIDFGNMPQGIDSRQVVGALLDGLPPDKANQLNAVAMGGHRATIDFGQIPIQRQGTPEMQGSIYQDQPKTRFLMRNIVRPAAEIAGQGLGGVLGAAAGTPEAPGIGTAALGMAGATAGGTVADELMNKADQALGLSHPEWQPPTSITGRVGREAAANAAMVGGGKVAGKALSELAAPFAESVNPEVQGAAKELNIPLTAAQQSNSKLLAQSEQMAAKLPGSSGILGDFYAKTRARMMDIANNLFQNKNMNPQIAAQVGDSINNQLVQKTNELAQTGVTPQLDPADVGESVASDISNFSKAAMQKSQATFNALKSSAPAAPIPLDAAGGQAEKLLAQQKGIGALSDGKLVSVLKDLTPVAVRPSGMLGIVSAMKTIPDILSLRSALGEAAAQHEAAFATTQPGTKFMGDSVSGAYKSLINGLDKDLENVQEGQFAKQYAAARGAHAETTNMMQNPYIRRILTTEQPEQVVDLAVRKGDVSNLPMLQKMVSPETYEQLGNAFQNKLIENSQNADGQFMPQKLAQQIKSYGERTISQAIGPDGLQNLKKLSNLSDGSFTDPGFRQFVSDIGRKNGENVSSFLLGASPQNINRVRALVGEQGFGEAQDGMIHNLLTNNQDNIDFAGLGKRLSQIPPESLMTALPPEKVATLQKLATVGGGIKASQREFMNPSGTAPMMGMFYILRQLFSNPMNAVKVLGGLAAGSEAYTKEPVTRYLTQGAVNPAAAETVGSTAAKIPISLVGQGLENPYGRRHRP